MIMCGNDPKVAGLLLKSMSLFKGDDGKEKYVDSLEHLRKLGDKWTNTIYGKSKAEWEKWNNEGGTPYIVDDFKVEEAINKDAGKNGEASTDDDTPFG
jgi:hypothetical protein